MTAEDAPSVGRLLSFSDAVFAIAITLLALELRIPEIPHATSARELVRALRGADAQFLTYGITFAVIGVYWLGHHRMFRHIAGHHRRLAELNLLILFAVSFLPFPANLLGRYPDNRTAVIIYGSNLAAVSAASAALWLYAMRAGLTEANLDPTLGRYLLLRPLVTGAVFLVSIGVAFASTTCATRTWYAAFVVFLAMRRAFPAAVRD